MSDESLAGDDERGSEVEDYTGEVPRPPTSDAPGPARPPSEVGSGLGDGDVADVDDADSVIDDDLASSIFDIAALIAERDAMKELAMRVQADFENYRRRMATQHSAEVDRATGRLAEALLPVLDAAEAAYIQHPEEVGPLLNVLLGELRKQGLETLDIEDQPFDPEVADAVAHEPGDGHEVVVAEVLRSGYRWRGKTLRPAMVRTKDRTAGV
ncbi:MAG TPA: nucleotide exchange factor GrpE [Ilumatobacter sp.]